MSPECNEVLRDVTAYRPCDCVRNVLLISRFLANCCLCRFLHGACSTDMACMQQQQLGGGCEMHHLCTVMSKRSSPLACVLHCTVLCLQTAVRIAGGRAVCRLYNVHRNLGPALTTAMTTLLGPDQAPEVQRQAMMSLTRLAGSEGALAPHLPGLLPSICSILQREPNSQVRLAAEALLKKRLGLEAGLEAGQAAAAAAGGTTKTFLTDAYLRRLASRQADDWEEVEEY